METLQFFSENPRAILWALGWLLFVAFTIYHGIDKGQRAGKSMDKWWARIWRERREKF